MLYYNIKILSDAKYSFERQEVYPLPFLPTLLQVKGIANIKFQVFVYINKTMKNNIICELLKILKGCVKKLCTGW